MAHKRIVDNLPAWKRNEIAAALFVAFPVHPDEIKALLAETGSVDRTIEILSRLEKVRGGALPTEDI